MAENSSPLLTLAGGNYNVEKEHLSVAAQEVVNRAVSGLPEGAFRDYHVHIIGIGAGGTGCYVHKSMFKWYRPVMRLKYKLLANTTGITEKRKADQQYMERLLRLAKKFPFGGRFYILAMAEHYNKKNGREKKNTQLHVPNEYVMEVAKSNPDVFVPVGSVHPYDKNALQKLDQLAENGCRMIKWLPNTMGMDPYDDACIPFYRKMNEHRMVLLGHAGGEESLKTSGYQHYGNPQRYRKALDEGVKLIMAHCAGTGKNRDLEKKGKLVDNFSVFLQLMEEKQYEGRLFGDISAMLLLNRSGENLQTILSRTDLHHRLVHGSDYPLPAANFNISLRLLQTRGYITKEERVALKEIYTYNPLLFDFVAKRTIRHPEKATMFPLSVFMHQPALGLE